MVTQFTLRRQKQNKAGECPVYLMVYFDGARAEFVYYLDQGAPAFLC